jgi:hypothetical protein
MLKRALAAVLLLCSIAWPAHAGGNPCSSSAATPDHGGFELFSGAWKYGIGGQISEGGSAISLSQDQGIQVSGQPLTYLRWCPANHRWWLPDFGLGYEHLGASGSYLAPSNLQFGSIVIIKDQTVVQAGVNLNSFDSSADWRLPALFDRRLQAGLGFGLKYLSGHYTVSGINDASALGIIGLLQVSEEEHDTIYQWVPMLHGHAEALPWDWLRLSLSGGYATLEGDHLAEWRGAVDFQVAKPVSLTAGYLMQLYRVKESPTVVDARVGGAMFGISLRTW